jgi:signal transduction histidine kinase/ActR/RegA family two-component response regulator
MSIGYLDNLSVKARLLIIVALGFSGMALLVFENYRAVQAMATQGNLMQSVTLTETSLIGAIRLSVEQIHSNVNRGPSELDLRKLRTYEELIAGNIRSINQMIDRLKRSNPAGYGELTTAFIADLNAMAGQATTVFKFAQDFSAGQANDVLTVGYAEALTKVREGLSRLTERVRSQADEAAAELEETGLSAVRMTILIAFIGLFLTIVPSLVLSSRISRRLTLLARATAAFANDDFNEIGVERIRGRDEIAAMANALGIFKQNALRLKAMDADLRLAKEASESSNRAKSEFLANMSHEIRTPLNGVLGMAQSLATDDLPPEQQEKINIILDSGNSLTAMLNDVLDFSKIEAGKLDIAAVPGDLVYAIERTLQLFKPRADEKGINLVVHYAQDLPRHLVYDPIRVRQCISNLLSNAIKFTHQGTVETSVSSQSTGGNDHLVTVAISDPGVGMNVQALSRLFSAFTQADAATTREFGGTGLGLAISRKLARLMGGDISVTSQKGVGSIFLLTFTSQSASAETSVLSKPTQPLPSQSNIRGVRVLLTDDNSTNRKVVKLFLAPHGCLITEAENGKETLEKLASEPFDLVLLDIHMPVMDGAQTIQAIRRSAESWHRVPVIALTADAMVGDREKYLALGMDAFVTKPIDARELIAQMHQVLAIEGKHHREAKFLNESGVV